MYKQLRLLNSNLLDRYKETIPQNLQTLFETLADVQPAVQKFDFYTSVSAVFSSKIEGEKIELDSYIKHKSQIASYQPDYTKKIDDLYEAYLFARDRRLSYQNVLDRHKILTTNLLQLQKQGHVRTGLMYVLTDEGKIEYVAASPEKLNKEFSIFFEDVEMLLSMDLNFAEVFYFASIIHLLFVKIHPFEDGNGRMARLLEKWFLAEKLGEKAWLVGSEKYYYQHHNEYYKNIRLLGLEYDDLSYQNALPFLQMLPKSLTEKQQDI